MASKRKYLPISKYPVYSKEFDRLRMASNILNENPQISVHTIFWDKALLKTKLIEIVGNFIPTAQEKLQDIKYQFEDYQNQCRNSGFDVPTELTEDLQDMKYRLDANLDVLFEEKELIQERLKAISDQVEKVDEARVLQYGLQCAGSFKGIGTPWYQPEIAPAMIDGQRLEMLAREKILVISEPSSIFYGMAVSDYRKLAKTWMSDRLKADEELLKRLQMEAKAEGLPKPNSTGRNLHCSISKADLPNWPEGVKNWKIKSDDEVEYKRKPKSLQPYKK